MTDGYTTVSIVVWVIMSARVTAVGVEFIFHNGFTHASMLSQETASLWEAVGVYEV